MGIGVFNCINAKWLKKIENIFLFKNSKTQEKRHEQSVNSIEYMAENRNTLQPCIEMQKNRTQIEGASHMIKSAALLSLVCTSMCSRLPLQKWCSNGVFWYARA